MMAPVTCTALALLSIGLSNAAKLYASSFATPGVNASYDYVIVCGGTAGLTTASRLAENPNVTVAVIEAGGFYQLEGGDGR